MVGLQRVSKRWNRGPRTLTASSTICVETTLQPLYIAAPQTSRSAPHCVRIAGSRRLPVRRSNLYRQTLELVLTGLATFQVVGYTKAISNGVVGNEAMRPASVGRVTVAESPERNDLTQLLSFWCIFGAGQGRLGTRKRNRSNDLDLICVHLEGRRSIQLSYGRIVYYLDFRTFLALRNHLLFGSARDIQLPNSA